MAEQKREPVKDANEALKLRSPNFRTLRVNEIEVRLVDVTQEAATVLLYSKAEAVRAVLNETLGGVFGWHCRHFACGRGVYCAIGISNGKEIVWKDDVGTGNALEPVKGEASDSFKRAARMWGIGTELLTLPKLRLGADKIIIVPDDQRKNSWKVTDQLHVESIAYDDERQIVALTLQNQSGKRIIWQRSSEES